MPQPEPLLKLLADGRFHSGEAIGRALGIGRSAVWKQVRSLEPLGLDVHAVRGRGYRLAAPLDLLDRDRVLARLPDAARRRLRSLDVLGLVHSTSRVLAARARAGDVAPPAACLAEGQSAGRGRRGRAWVSPYARNLYLSVLWRLDRPAAGLPALGLATAVAVAEAIDEAGDAIGLKWPNDLVHEGAKLGGILVELSGEPEGPWEAIVGVGVNVDMSETAGAAVDQRWTDLRRVRGHAPDRNDVAARTLAALVDALDTFAAEGFTPFRARFDARDAIRRRRVVVHAPQRPDREGTALGIDADGALRLETPAGVERVLGGEVSVRAAP